MKFGRSTDYVTEKFYGYFAESAKGASTYAPRDGKYVFDVAERIRAGLTPDFSVEIIEESTLKALGLVDLRSIGATSIVSVSVRYTYRLDAEDLFTEGETSDVFGHLDPLWEMRRSPLADIQTDLRDILLRPGELIADPVAVKPSLSFIDLINCRGVRVSWPRLSGSELDNWFSDGSAKCFSYPRSEIEGALDKMERAFNRELTAFAKACRKAGAEDKHIIKHKVAKGIGALLSDRTPQVNPRLVRRFTTSGWLFYGKA